MKKKKSFFRYKKLKTLYTRTRIFMWAISTIIKNKNYRIMREWDPELCAAPHTNTSYFILKKLTSRPF